MEVPGGEAVQWADRSRQASAKRVGERDTEREMPGVVARSDSVSLPQGSRGRAQN